ncbi:MAG: AAA family ATPase [Myxococcota bacterium]
MDPALAESFGLRTVSAVEANYALGRTDLPLHGKYLLVPYPSGVRIRVTPKLNGIGKDLAPSRDQAPNPDVYPLDDGEGPLYVVESAIKALALYGIGKRAVGLAGVATGLVKGKAELNSHWSVLPPLKGRDVCIAFDSNWDKKGVADAEVRYVKALRREGAKVRVARLPKAEDGSDQGPDDLLLRHGSEALQKIFQEAYEPEDHQDTKKAWRTAQEILDDQSIPDTSWLWQDVVPAGELTVLAGQGGTGKTTLLAHLAARLSRGEVIPRSMKKVDMGAHHPSFLAANPTQEHPPINVGIMRSEVKPKAIAQKLKVSNADMERIIVREDAQIRLPTDWPVVEELIRDRELGLLIIDCISDFMADLDPNSAADVRRLLSPAVDMAQRTGCAIIAVRHFRKGENSVSGSHEWRDVPRSVIGLKEAGEKWRSKVWLEKGSDADGSAPVVSFRTVMEPVPGQLGKQALHIEVVEAPAETPKPKLSPDQELAAKGLEAALKGQGWRPSAEVVAEISDSEGVSPSTIKKTRSFLKLGVRKMEGTKTEWSWDEPSPEGA